MARAGTTYQWKANSNGGFHRGTKFDEVAVDDLRHTGNSALYILTESGRIVRYDHQNWHYEQPADVRAEKRNWMQGQPLVRLPNGTTFKVGTRLPNAGRLKDGNRLGRIAELIEVGDTLYPSDPTVTTRPGISPHVAFRNRVEATDRVFVHSDPGRGRLITEGEGFARGARTRERIERRVAPAGTVAVRVGFEVAGKGGWIPLTGLDRPARIAFDTQNCSYSIEFGTSGEALLFRLSGRKQEIARWKPKLGEVLESGERCDNARIADLSEVTPAVGVVADTTLDAARAGGYGTQATTKALVLDMQLTQTNSPVQTI